MYVHNVHVRAYVHVRTVHVGNIGGIVTRLDRLYASNITRCAKATYTCTYILHTCTTSRTYAHLMNSHLLYMYREYYYSTQQKH